ncbi:MAG: hypothetical protein WD824_05785 [Cyclobacteriaceae bacterium]
MKLNIYYCLGSMLICLMIAANVQGQGCVAVKNMTSHSLNFGDDSHKGWQFSLNYRYFRSYKHFRGEHEEVDRVKNGTEVINNDNSVNIGVNYTFNSRWSATVAIPLIYIDRSSLYEHSGNNGGRFHTQSKGLGDIRATAYYNTTPASQSGHFVVGLGFKAPTGDYNYQDYFHKPEGLVLLPVDQSMQLGDGGWGLITEIDFARKIQGKFSGYVNAMYMFNPKNTNGVLRRATPYTMPVTDVAIPLSNEMSVGDQYFWRAGAMFSTNGIQASLGARMEGIPSEDILGKTDGFRRPGYIISMEPAIFYSTGAHSFGVNFPIALERNRTRNVVDKTQGNNPNTGEPIIGDAAFADWLLSFTYAFRLMK